MSDQAGQQRELVFCHACENEWLREQHGLQCPNCHSDIVEIIDERHDPRHNHITSSDDDGDDTATTNNVSNDSLPRHPLHHHNPWQADPADPDEPDIEHVEWNPAPGVHFARTSYRSSTPGIGPRGQGTANDAFAPLFQSFSTLFQGAANAPGRPPGSPREGQGRSLPNINRPEFASQNPFPDHRHHHMHHNHQGPWNPATGPPGGRNAFTATGRWPRNGSPDVFPGNSDGNNLHAVLATLLQTMQAGMVQQGNGPQNGMPHIQTFISSMLGNGAHGDAVYTDEALDRIITQMMDQTNAHSAPGPASAAAIAALPKQKADKSMMGQDGKAECSVCMDAVEVGDEVTMLPCKHWFHGDCVGAWLKEHDTCPHCRQGIMPKDSPEDANSSRSPGEAPRNDHDPDRADQGPPPPAQSYNGMDQQPPIPGAFTQPGMNQPYVPGGFPRSSEPRNFVVPPSQRQGHQPSTQLPPPLHQTHPGHRRRSSARERSSVNGGEGSSGGQGVTGWFRNLRGGNSSGDR